jgi:predicted dehydrogenase
MKKISRRDFVQSGAAAGALAGLPMVHNGVQDHKTLLVGAIGCGGRGTGAIENCLESSPDVEIVAMGDMFKERIDGSRRSMAAKKHPGFKVNEDKIFTGVDAYKRVLDSGVDMVILATPPGFRPIHFAAAIDAGKHVFFEKPVAVDPVGVRKVMEYGKKAKEKNLAVVTGTQRRHQKPYVETIGAIHDGVMGQVLSGRVYWNGNRPWFRERKPGMTDYEYQCHNWYQFDWVCGDHIVEQHIHNLDVANWVMKGHPLKCTAVGGRQVWTDPAKCGNVWDHFALDLEYAGGVHVMSMCRHWPGPGNVSEAFVGTKGKTDCHSYISDHDGKSLFKPAGGGKNPYVQEHTDLIASIRSGKLLNEAQQVAESTLVAIMGREAAYTGKVLEWDKFLASDLDLTPKVGPNGEVQGRGVPMPGQPR